MIKDKIISFPELEKLAGRLHEQGKRIVFTNGCFDIIHAGHVQYLETARELGDVLIVGLNSDASVRRLKGDQRPIVAQQHRLTTLAALESVSYVCMFEEDTPLGLIQAIHPDVLVKGGDWSIDTIVGADFVLAYGAKVHSLSFVEGISTTEIITRIKEL
ncbi:MAG TPA: D-glycero-beta-D-manno-heptose 1-phosphate adenylyltransferase [Candidatus Cloacimonadota bacterium]|nr:D-glycero-beta-D-manno-heptose 1-phosphate adenylyltransferase [Candidatus Cloacimonadota bacterium]